MTRTLIGLALLCATRAAAQDTTPPKPAPAPAATSTAPAAATAASGISVMDAVIAKSVVDRAPQDTATTFPADVGQLICYTRLSGAAGSVHHAWYHGDSLVADVELQVGGSPWRTWSRKTIPAGWTGAWRVEIRDASGAVLKRIDFTVGS